jgi:hypothetical protein
MIPKDYAPVSRAPQELKKEKKHKKPKGTVNPSSGRLTYLSLILF